MKANKLRICIVGGGATGISLLWCLAQHKKFKEELEITVIHDQETLGGHSNTLPVHQSGKTYNIDIGVQYISPMIYPNVAAMLQLPEFKSRVSVANCDELKIACSFPRDSKGAPQTWGNFKEYQHPSKSKLYNEDVKQDSILFQKFIEKSVFNGTRNQSLKEHFDLFSRQYKDANRFIHYFLWPYLSIINGYGAHLMDKTSFTDMFPLFSRIPFFSTPLGSFNDPGVGWQRFERGASDWIQAMAEVASLYTKPIIICNSRVTKVWAKDEGSKAVVYVKWQDTDGNSDESTFDKVILTTDMWTNAEILNNDNNEYYWSNLYRNYIDKSQWPLHPGMCYIHKDSTVLSPDLRDELETLQFTGDFAPQNEYPYYELEKTFTTYIQKNILQDLGAKGLYVTMYGYIPDTKVDKIPAPESILFQQEWRHGMWVPSFMGGQKKLVHKVQGVGAKNSFKQPNTNIYFAGNNTTTDSEEGALISAMITANYVFGIPYPLKGNLLAYFFYNLFYRKVLFPNT